MPVQTRNILIFGATGLVGKHITNAILDKKSNFEKIAIFTSPKTIKDKAEHINTLKARGIEVISGDTTSVDDVKNAYNGFDTVVSCVGRPVIHTQIQLVQLADEHPDIKRFLPSEYGTDIEYDSSSVNEKPHQQKLKVRAALKEVKDLEYTYVVTGPYGDADNHLYLGPIAVENEESGTFDVRRKRAVVIGTGDHKISLTTMRDVGRLTVAALLNSEVSRNRALRVNSFTATPREIVAEYEKQTGGQSWDVSYTSLERLKELEKQAWDRGDPRAGPLTLRRIWAEGKTLYDERDNGLIGMDKDVDSLESAVAQAVSVQTKAA